MTTPGSVLHNRVRSGQPLLLPGAPNAVTARLIEDLGFDAVYLSGAGIANAYLGLPDLGFLSLPEIAAHVAATRDVVSIPIVVDGDTGFGNALGAARTARTLERAGANAMQLEDQVSPKKCGHFDGKDVISLAEMVGKIHAVLDARDSEDLLLIARTDARAVDGIDEACDRASRFLEEGADIAFVEAPTSVDELILIPQRVDGPLLVNIVEGAKTPQLTFQDLVDAGYNMVLYANTALRGAIAGAQTVLASLRQHGDTLAVLDQIASWQTRQSLVRLPDFEALDRKYAATTTS